DDRCRRRAGDRTLTSAQWDAAASTGPTTGVVGETTREPNTAELRILLQRGRRPVSSERRYGILRVAGVSVLLQRGRRPVSSESFAGASIGRVASIRLQGGRRPVSSERRGPHGRLHREMHASTGPTTGVVGEPPCPR